MPSVGRPQSNSDGSAARVSARARDACALKKCSSEIALRRSSIFQGSLLNTGNSWVHSLKQCTASEGSCLLRLRYARRGKRKRAPKCELPIARPQIQCSARLFPFFLWQCERELGARAVTRMGLWIEGSTEPRRRAPE